MTSRTSPCTDCQGGGRRASRAGLLRQFSLAGNCVAELHLATHVFLVGNHISDEQRDKEQERAQEKMRQNLRN